MVGQSGNEDTLQFVMGCFLGYGMSHDGIFMVMEYGLVPSSVIKHGLEIPELNGHLYMGKSCN
jgi:hypothetical protein